MFGKIVLISFFVASAKTSAPGNSRIVNGEVAQAGEFPWQAAIYSTLQGRTVFCGGALVHEQWVYTSASCAYNASQFTIYLGSNSLIATDPNRVIISTDEAVVHPQYNPQSLDNDVALINLKTPVTLTDNIKVIEIDARYLLTGGLVTVSGWGTTSDSNNQISEVLNYVSLQSISYSECTDYYGNELITGRMMCAVGVGQLQGPCAGDIGSPLIAFDFDGNVHHVGSVTFVSSAGCGSTYPSGYTRSSYYKQWADGVISEYKTKSL